ncbi:MAG: TRAP transporter substrate-binding protein DctP [Beijerinckiaceae bacterium]
MLNSIKPKPYKPLAAAALAASLFASSAADARTYRLTVAAGQVPKAIASLLAVETFFVPEVVKRIKAAGLKDEVAFRQAYAGSLIKPRAVLLGTQDGISDIGFVPGVFHPDKLPLAQPSFATPFCTTDTAKVTKAGEAVMEKVPEARAAFDKFKLELIGSSSGDTFQFFTNFPVEKIEDLKGRKLATTGALLQWYKGLGVTAVDSNMMEYYNSTQTGVYQGFIIMGSAAVPMRYPEAAPFVNKVDFGATWTNFLVMNKNSLARLPKEIQTIIRQVGKEWGAVSDKATAARAEGGLKAVTKVFPKATVKPLADTERKRWAMAMPNVAKQWASDLDAKGLPGSKVLSVYMDALRAQGVTCLRQWDKE